MSDNYLGEKVSAISFFVSSWCTLVTPTAEAAYGFLLTSDNCIIKTIQYYYVNDLSCGYSSGSRIYFCRNYSSGIKLSERKEKEKMHQLEFEPTPSRSEAQHAERRCNIP